MRQYTFKLDKKMQRPVIVLSNGLTALLDTGAYIPVWASGEDVLTTRLGAQFVKSGVPITGFGGSTTGNLYKVSIDVGGIIYPEMHIVANDDLEVSFNFIISATMFDGLIYRIDTVNHVLNVDVPDNESNIRNLRVMDSEGRLHVLCEGAEESEEEIRKRLGF